MHAHPEPQAGRSLMYGKSRVELVAADLDESIPFYTKGLKSGAIGGAPTLGVADNTLAGRKSASPALLPSDRAPMWTFKLTLCLASTEARAGLSTISEGLELGRSPHRPPDHFRAERSASSIDGSRKL